MTETLSIHAPARGATSHAAFQSPRSTANFQSTHPRGVRRRRRAAAADHRHLSIHAPARGATHFASSSSGKFGSLSIHAPARGATGDRLNVRVRPDILSIHAPARGATRPEAGPIRRRASFNPRTRAGCDLRRSSKSKSGTTTFQSTHPRGVRPTVPVPDPPAAAFQSTHPRGVRLHVRDRVGRELADLSIHAPARGATLISARMSLDSVFAFQSTHPRGVRRSSRSCSRAQRRYFQSTHPRGVRQESANILHISSALSIHAPARGATHSSPISRSLFSFQSTHPRGVRRA